jgi:Mg-chelatase subunit ChlD
MNISFMRNSLFAVGFIIGVTGMLLPFSGCDWLFGDDVKEFTLLADYTNPIGGHPDIDLVEEDRSSEIDLSGSSTETIESQGRVRIQIGNVRFRNNDTVYEIVDEDGVITEEERENGFVRDVENQLERDRSQSISIVLVLDVSSSLGDDVSRVKDYAVEFVETIFAQAEGSVNVGVVGFSDFVDSSPLTQNANSLNSFIQSLPEDRDETKLYQAVDVAVDMIQNVNSDGRAIVVFTDGTNNSWDDERYSTIGYVETRLNELENTSSYAIGFEGRGNLDRTALGRLAVGGETEFPESSDELQNVFNRFARTVSSVYTFIYDTNDSQFSGVRRLRFTFRALPL